MTTIATISGLAVEPGTETRSTEKRVQELHAERMHVERHLAQARTQLAAAVADGLPPEEQHRLQAECTRLVEQDQGIVSALDLLDARLVTHRAADTAAAVQRKQDSADQLEHESHAAATALYQHLAQLAGAELVELYERAERTQAIAVAARRDAARVTALAAGATASDAAYTARETYLTALPQPGRHTWPDVWDTARVLARFAGAARVPLTTSEQAHLSQTTAGLPTVPAPTL